MPVPLPSPAGLTKTLDAGPDSAAVDTIAPQKLGGSKPAWIATMPKPRELAGAGKSLLSFWTVVPVIGLLGMLYLWGFSDSMFVSQTIFNLQNAQSSASSSLSSLVSSSLLGGNSTSSEAGALMTYIASPEMLHRLDKQFHLRQLYSSKTHSPFWRLAPDATDQDFLAFYQQMVTVTQDPTTQLLTLSVTDYDAKHAAAVAKAVLTASTDFVNSLTKQMQDATLRYAKIQLVASQKAVEQAQPVDRPIAEAELSAAQSAVASAQGVASQQVVFLIPISAPTVPSESTVPDRLVNEAGILLCAAIFYMIANLLMSNVRDHRTA